MPTASITAMNLSMGEQIPFSLSTQEHATFENFFAAAGHPVLSLLQSLGGEDAPRLIYLWGAAGGGKSHLLSASCSRLEQQGVRTLYLPMKVLSQQPGKRALTLLEGLSIYSVVVLDDLDAVVGTPHWEETLFHLLNQTGDQQQQLVISGQMPVAELDIQLPDLRSRLGEAVSGQLQPLSAEEKWKVLQQRAEVRGMKISDEVAHFLMQRTARDFHALFALLERLDRETLAAQRKITIPFVKELLRL